MRRPVYFIFICMVSITSLQLAHAEDLNVSTEQTFKTLKLLTAAAQRPVKMPGDNTKIFFSFDENAELKAWLRDNGDWHLEGWIKHNRFRCGSYRLGLRFGKGNFSCANVNWMTETQFIGKKTQCNQSQMHHSGYNTSPSISSLTHEITCAQLVIQCSGTCN